MNGVTIVKLGLWRVCQLSEDRWFCGDIDCLSGPGRGRTLCAKLLAARAFMTLACIFSILSGICLFGRLIIGVSIGIATFMEGGEENLYVGWSLGLAALVANLIGATLAFSVPRASRERRGLWQLALLCSWVSHWSCSNRVLKSFPTKNEALFLFSPTSQSHPQEGRPMSNTLIVSSNFFNVDRTESRSLTNPCSGVFGNDGCSTIDRKGILRVMHHRTVIIGQIQCISGIGGVFVEIVFASLVRKNWKTLFERVRCHTRLDIAEIDRDVIISICTGLFVPKAQRWKSQRSSRSDNVWCFSLTMDELMHDRCFSIDAITLHL